MQTTALTARRTLVEAAMSRQTTAVALIRALGGGWDADMPSTADRAAVGGPPPKG